MSLTDVLNAALYAALAIIVFKLVVIMFKKGHDAFYIPPEARPFDEDEEEDEELADDVMKNALPSDRMLCPQCGVTVIAMPEIGEQAICDACKEKVVKNLEKKDD